MNKELKNAVKATDKEAQYDESAKRLLGQKSILSHILVKTVNEFKGMNPKEVVSYIEGTPYISTVPVEPGLTNTRIFKEAVNGVYGTGSTDGSHINPGQRIIGLNSESSEIHEGLVRFDIIFYVRMRDGLSQMIVNVEAQKDEPKEYDILNRAIFYVSRMVSSQKERDFTNTCYDDIKRVYSIWVCLNMSTNSLTHIHLAKDELLGNYEWKGKLDLLNIVMIGLATELPEHDTEYELHRLLGALLSRTLTADEKLNIIGNEYNIPVENSLREGVNVMCNLSQGIKEEAMALGEAIGESKAEERIIISMHNNGFTPEQIAAVTDKNIADVKAIIENKE